MSITSLLRSRASWSGLAVALVTALCATTVAACGGGGGGGVANVIDPVAQAATTSSKTAGYRLNMALTMTSSALPNPITGIGHGAFDVPNHAGSFTLDMNLGNSPQIVQALGGSTLQVQELIKGQTIFMKLPTALTSRVPAFGGKPWIEVDLAKLLNSKGLGGLSSLTSNPATGDPSQMLSYLRAASGKVTTVGTDQVNGVQTTHYRGAISLDRVANVLPAASRATARQSIQALEKLTNLRQLPFDVWVDGQHLVRRLGISFSESISGQSLKMSMKIEIPQYGPQPAPAIPPADQVTNLNALAGAGG
ncbi:MAG: hypothetical protein M3018_10700 [Actinomycetota bacterium]|nr:hypothetical protein [Actinomycetota bacterium]